MSKKRSKSNVGSAGLQRWEQAILTGQFCEEEKWQATVAFVIGNQLEDYKHIEALTGAVNSGVRRLFSVITKNELYEQVNELGNPRGKKPKDVPAYCEICEPCKQYLDNGEDIPLPLLAKLLKWKLLDVKQKDFRRREAEKKALSEKDKGKKGDKKERTKSPAKGKGGKKTPEPPSAKTESKLRKRGEEDPDGKYIDDEPDDGSDHYIMVSGLHHPHLPSQLAELGVHIDSIIKVESDDYAGLQPPSGSGSDTDREPLDDKQLALNEVVLNQKLQSEKELKKFWEDVLQLMRKAPPMSKLHDVACLNYNVKSELFPDNLEDAEKKMEYGTSLFEDVACIMYDLLDSRRHWQCYLQNLKVQNVPEVGHAVVPAVVGADVNPSMPSLTPAATQAKSESVSQIEGKSEPATEILGDMRFYNELMNSVPQESVSVPLVMHCMLEQVSATVEDKPPPSETPHPGRNDGLDQTLASHLGSVAFKLALSDNEIEMLAKEFQPPKQPDPILKQPVLINYHDDISCRLNHLKPFVRLDARKAELEMMGHLPSSNLNNFPHPSEKASKERAARLQELIHFCSNSSLGPAEMDRAFKQLVFECMDLTGTDKDGSVDPECFLKQNDIPWDDPYPYYKGMIAQWVEEDTVDVKPSEDQFTIPSEAVTPSEMLVEDNRSGSDSSSPGPAPEMPAPPLSSDDEDSRPSSAGIMKRTDRKGSAGSRKSTSGHSVHFSAMDDVALQDKPFFSGLDVGQSQAYLDSMEETNDVEKRNLDRWCFAEHLDAEELIQVLNKTSYTHPYMNTYYHRRDNSLMVVLHNPYNAALYSYTDWQTKLHSDVGFRNYLEHVADLESVSDFIREQDAKYQASLLAKEVERIQKEADEAASRPTSSTKKRDRSKSPKKSPARGKSPSRSSSTERASSSNPYVRQGSLKAWKEEQDRVKAEEDEKEKLKNEKRARSAQKKATKDQAAKEEKEKGKESKRPGSRGSVKSKNSKEEVVPPEASAEEPVAEEQFWPFKGYDTGNHLLHVSGVVSTMLPADGGQIRSEKVHFEQGATNIHTTVMKDGHLFNVHILDPKPMDEGNVTNNADGRDEVVEKADVETTEKTQEEKEPEAEISDEQEGSQSPHKSPEPEVVKKPCVGRYGSFSAQLVDGMCISLSTYGPTGEPVDGKPYEPEPFNLPPPRSPTPVGKDSPSKSKKGGDKNKTEKIATPEPAVETDVVEEEEEEPAPPHQPFLQLNVTSPDGLCTSYMLESAVGIIGNDPEERQLLVKQSYPYKTDGVQGCEAERKHAMDESSRIINRDGTVVKTMLDGSVQVLFSNGTVSQFVQHSPLIPESEETAQQRPTSGKSETDVPNKKSSKPGRRSAKKTEHQEATVVEEEPVEKGFWITTTSTGQRVVTRLDGSSVDVKDALISSSSDPMTGQSMHTRQDKVIMIYHPDGSTVVEHADGTRITTNLRQVEVPAEDTETDETGEVTEIVTKYLHQIRVECPGFATVLFDEQDCLCQTEFGNGTSLQVSPSGQYELCHITGGRLSIDEEGHAIYHPQPNNSVEMRDPSRPLQYVMKHSADVICETVDNEGNVFNVKNNGECLVLPAEGTEVIEAEKPTLFIPPDEDNDPLQQQEEKRDEDKAVISKQVVYYKQHAPKLFVIRPDGSGTQLLRYEDVADYIAEAEDDPSTAILVDPLPDYPGVLGITILKPYLKDISQQWLTNYMESNIIPAGLTSRDLQSFPPTENVQEGPQFGTSTGRGLMVGGSMKQTMVQPILKCPSALQVRQILQYKPMSGQLRTSLSQGLQNYADFVKKRQESMHSLLVQDPRTEEEKQRAANLEVEAEAWMSKAPADNAEDKAGDSIEVLPSEGQTKFLDGDVKALYEKATAAPLPSPPPTPQAKRTKADWERDERELAEESEARQDLRQHTIPPYFESEFGKAFLLSQAPDMDALSRQLADDPRRDGSAALRTSTTASSCSDNSHQETQQDTSDICPTRLSDGSLPCSDNTPSPQTAESGNTPSALRPGNPTPAHADGKGSPAPVRPQHPTPAHAVQTIQERPEGPTPKSTEKNEENPSTLPNENEKQFTQDNINMNQSLEPGSDVNRTKSTLVDVVGKPRIEPVHIPAYTYSSRPGAIPNDRYMNIEDPVRRKVNTTSVAGATLKGRYILASMQGFQLLPDKVDFGVLKEGVTYSFLVNLKNTGVDSCHFKLRQPPPATGMRVLYKPGPIAAGMKAKLTIEVYAIAAGVEGERGVGFVNHMLEITTETEHLSLPISATVLTTDEYDKQHRDNAEVGPQPGVRVVTNKPPNTQGIIRPRRTPEKEAGKTAA